MSELLLPIGSVVQLREAEKPVMIFGVYQQRVTDGRNFDYIGEAYPEGSSEGSPICCLTRRILPRCCLPAIRRRNMRV